MEDSQIIDLYWQRSERAIAESESRYGRYCHAIAFNFTLSHEDAEECVSDTWLSAWNAMPDERPRVLGAFFGTLARRHAINRWKSRTRKKRGGGEIPLALEELSECIPSDQDPERRVEERELAAAIRLFVDELNEQERRVFLARYWYLAPVEEIARRMDFSRSKVKSMLFRLRGRLRERLTEEGLC